MSAIERAVVGRKTPADGKLEITAALAHELGGDGAEIEVRVASAEVRGVVEAMPCTCAKAGASGKHEHHFVQCDVFRELGVGTQLQLTARRARLEVALA